MLDKPSACSSCPAYSTGRGFVPPSGPSTATMVLVGQPEPDDAATGEPLTNRALDKWLVRANVPKEQLALGNIVQCHLPGKGGRGTRPPKKSEAAHCWKAHVGPWLDSLPAAKVVVPVGVPAIEAALEDGVTASVAGTLHHSPAGWPGKLLAPLLHPTAIQQGQWALEPAQLRFLRRAWWLAQQHAESLPGSVVDVREPPAGANPVPTLDDLRDFVTSSHRLPDTRMACDIEGTGGRIIGIGWCRLADERTIYVPFLDTDAPYWHDEEWPEVDRLVRELLAFPLIMHNGQAFDVPFLESCGYEVPCYVDDTMIRHHILYAEMPKDLESLAILYCGFPSWKFLSKLEGGDAK